MQNLNKYIAGVVIASCLIPSISFAGFKGGYCGQYSSEYRDRSYGKRDFKDLNLTREQKEQIKNIRHEQHKNMFAIRDKYWNKLPNAEQQAMQKELNQSKLNSNNQIKKLLNKEQQAKFDDRQKQRDINRQEWDEFQKWKANKK